MKSILNKKFQFEFKETVADFCRSFLAIDKRMRKNIIIIATMIFIVIITGFFLAMVRLFQMGESFIDSKLASHKENTLITKIDKI